MIAGTVATYAAEVACLVLAVLLQWTYAAGNDWWTSRVGRALMTLAGSVEVIVGVAILRRIFGWGAWAGIVQLGLVVVALAALNVAFLRERKEVRRRTTARKDHRKGGKTMTPDRLLRYFEYEHLSPELQEVSKPFGALAEQLCTVLPASPERSVALRKLLEGKDAAVRAMVDELRDGDS